jgi:valyl-tRNA synthetase|tara:strand:- start:269 stop:3040 length:2772 start_codon:yes stop_codon:yes gene_type:complete
MDKSYDPKTIEVDWYNKWEKNNYFSPKGKGSPYCIMLPPPNVTGSLHMGHAFQQTLMDILVRYHRMNDSDVLWQCGTDHAGIATQMVVERQLQQEKVSRHDLGRKKFIDEVWKWKETSGNTISNQSRRLGTSMDWENERFTMDEGLSDAVREVFVKLYDKGLIYRGKRLVNWDPVLHTAISDLEVISEEENGHLWHMRYPLTESVQGIEHLVVATTRPETMLGDSAVAVHPDDDRYKELVGKKVSLPLTDRTIPIIADEYVDPEFGSGCVKITPAHDFNDYEVGERHNLEKINIFTADAIINDIAPKQYQGLDRFDARKKIISDLENKKLLEKTEDHKLMIPRGDRSNAIVEPYLTDQWYVKVKPLAEPAIKAVEDGSIKFVPKNWEKTYFEWMRNIEDWCISRQLWWGHRIPAWYDDDGNIFVGYSEKEVREKNNLGERKLKQDEDVLDTWFSSSLWPFSTLGWPEKTERLQKFYPTNVLVTGFDIIFFWVARMIMMGLKFTGEPPFKEVYIHGLVRDSDGQKMSKSKGNVLDPLDLINGITLEDLVTKRTVGLMQPQLAEKIEKSTRQHFPDGINAYGTDSLRFTFASLATQGRDIRFDIGRIDGYRNFCNKIWNATRFVLMNIESQKIDINNNKKTFGLTERWITSQLSKTLNATQEGIKTYRFDLASQALYEFVWNEYCDWYLEFSKSTLNDKAKSEEEKRGTLYTLVYVLEALVRSLHPFMPFITEELWHRVAPILDKNSETIMLESYPSESEFKKDEKADQEIEWIKSFIMGIRRIRSERDIPPGKELIVSTKGGTKKELEWLNKNELVIKMLGKIEKIVPTQDEVSDAALALAGEMTLLVPLADLINPQDEYNRICKMIENLEKEKMQLSAKLENKSFVDRAPKDVVDGAKQRLADTLSDIETYQEQLESISKLLP